MFQGVGVSRRPGGYSQQLLGGLPDQRVTWLGPAAALSAEHDPVLQLIRSGAEPTQRDRRRGERTDVGADRRLVLDRTGHDEALCPDRTARRMAAS